MNKFFMLTVSENWENFVDRPYGVFNSYPTESEILNVLSDWYGKMLKKYNKMDVLISSGKAKVSTSLIEIDFEIIQKNFGEPLR